MNKQQYLELLEHSYNHIKGLGFVEVGSRLDYLSNYIFDFTLYDADMDELFGAKAVEVCQAINNRTTFEYIEDEENYRWFLALCNMPFFSERINWGTSIRGAFWDEGIELSIFGLWVDGEQRTEAIKFNHEEWEWFIAAIIEFSKGKPC